MFRSFSPLGLLRRDSSRDNITFTLTVPTSQGTFALPRTTDSGIAINGRQSKLIITDYTFGSYGALLYTTAAIYFAGRIGQRDILFLHGFADQSHEFTLTLDGAGTRIKSSRVLFNSTLIQRSTTVTVLPGSAGLLTIWDSPTQLILFSDPVTAATFWAPAIRDETPETIKGYETYWQFGTNTTALIGGPYLVRNATLESDTRSRKELTLALRGDLNASVPLTVIAPPEVSSITWNGERVRVQNHGRGFFTGELTMSTSVKEAKNKVPELKGWRFADSLPEVQPGFDDSEWVVANRTTTNAFVKPLFGDGRVLYGACSAFGSSHGCSLKWAQDVTMNCESSAKLIGGVDFDRIDSCENTVLWRGHFNGTGAETSVNLTIYGGTCQYTISRSPAAMP